MPSLRRTLDHVLGVPLLQVARLFTSRKGEPPRDPLRHVLVIKLAAVGDTVLMVPLLRALRAALPYAQIDWLVSRTNLELAETVPYVNRLWLLDSFAPVALYKLLRTLRAVGYDAVLDLEQWAKGTPLLAWSTGAPHLLGFKTPGQYRDALFSESYVKRYDRHELDEFFGLTSLLAPIESDHRLELWVTDAGIKNLQDGAPTFDWITDRLLVLLHPGCGSDGRPREWPVSHYAEIARWLRATRKADILVSGGPEDRRVANALATAVPGAVNLCGRLNWQGTVALASRVGLVVSGNTGIMHIASAFQIPQIALHGPTNPSVWGPLNPKAVVIKSSCPQCPCLKLGFEYHTNDQSCMERISVTEVQAAINRLLPS